MERAAPFRGVHAGGAQGEQTRLMPPPRWAARGFGVLMEHLPPGPGPVLPPFQPPTPPPPPALSLVGSRAQVQVPGATAPATEKPFSGELKLGAQQPDSISTETVTVRALATGTWPAGIHVGAPTRVARCRVESSSPPSGAMAQRTWEGGGAAWLFRAFLAHPSSTAHWCGPRGDL